MTMLRLFAFALIALHAGRGACRPAGADPDARPRSNGKAARFSSRPRPLSRGTAQPPRPRLILHKFSGSRPELKGKIRLRLVPATADLANPEAYRLRVTAKAATITASDPKGLFYGAQTLRQLVTESAGRRAIAAATIADAPRFPGAAC